MTSAKVWFSSITKTTWAECGTPETGGGAGDGAGEGEGAGTGAGVGEGAGLGAGEGAGDGVGLGEGCELVGDWFEARELLPPAQPPMKRTDNTTTDRMKACDATERWKRMYPPTGNEVGGYGRTYSACTGRSPMQ